MSGSRARRSVGGQVAIEIVAVVVSLAISFFLSTIPVALEAQSARTNAKAAVQSGEAADLPTLVTSVELLKDNLAALATYSKTPTWLLAAHVPVLGEPVKTAVTVLDGANDVASSADGFLSIARLLTTSDKTAGQLLPPDVLNELGPAATQLADSLSRLDQSLATINVNAAFGPAQSSVQAARQDAQRLLPDLNLLLRALPSMAVLLGSQSPQTWFVAMQNGGESRGTGGLVGSFASITFTQGSAHTNQVGANDLLTAKADPAPLPQDTQQLWGPLRLAEIWGVNLSPNFPYAGELLSSLWKRQSGQAPNAVMAMDQRAAAALVAAAGPVVVDGITVTGENAYQWLTVGVYDRYPDTVGKDAFVVKLFEQLMARITSGSIPPLKIASSMIDSVLARDIFLWASDAEVQESIAPSIIGGVVPDTAGPFAMAVVNNNAGNKMDTFLHASVQYQGGECIPGGRRSTVSVELFNDPPAELSSYVGSRGDRAVWEGKSSLPDGSNRVRLAVYLPKGAYVANAVPKQLYAGQERGHPALMFGVELARGARQTVSVEFTEFGESELLNQAPDVLAQPMLNPQQISAEPGPQC